MLQEDTIILALFLAICETLGNKWNKKHSQGKLALSEVVLCGVLFALKGTSFRRFYVFLKKRQLMNLPDRSRLHRLLKTHRQCCNQFLSQPTFFNILDSFGVELIHPIREGRSVQSQTISKKGKSNHRWIVGRKINVALNGNLEVSQFEEATVNGCDNQFDDQYDTDKAIYLTDNGYRKKEGTPANFKICRKGTWGERMVVETLFSLWTRICSMKHSFHRTVEGFKTKLAYLVALTNIVVRLNEGLGYTRLSLVQWAL